MSSSTPVACAQRILGRVQEVWVELDYAQRRLLQIRTGISAPTVDQRLRADREIEALEALYALEERD